MLCLEQREVRGEPSFSQRQPSSRGCCCCRAPLVVPKLQGDPCSGSSLALFIGRQPVGVPGGLCHFPKLLQPTGPSLAGGLPPSGQSPCLQSRLPTHPSLGTEAKLLKREGEAVAYNIFPRNMWLFLARQEMFDSLEVCCSPHYSCLSHV